MKKRIALVLAGLLAVSSFAACDGKEESTTATTATTGTGTTGTGTTGTGTTGTGTEGSDTTEAPKTESKSYNDLAKELVKDLKGSAKDDKGEATNPTLNVVTTFAGADVGALDYISRCIAFQSAANVTIQDSSQTFTPTMDSAVKSNFASGAAADVYFYFATAQSDPFLDKLATVDEIKAKDSSYGSNYNMAKVPVSSDGEQYVLPENSYWEGLFYNKKLVEATATGLEKAVGKTAKYADFKQSITEIKAAGKEGIAVNLVSEPHYWFEFLILNQEADPAKEHGVKPANASDDAGKRWVAAFDELKTLFKDGYLISDATTVASTADAQSKFYNGSAAYYLDGHWARGGIEGSDAGKAGDISVGYFAGDNGRVATDIIGGASSGWIITKDALADDNKSEAAIEFIKFMTNDKVLAITTNMKGTNNALANPLPSDGNDSQLLTAAKAMVAGATLQLPAVQDTFDNVGLFKTGTTILKVVTDAATAEEAINAAVK